VAKPLITLDPETRKLAGRIATERHRRAIWSDAAKIRSEALERLRQGADQAAVSAWLHEELAGALAGQR